MANTEQQETIVVERQDAHGNWQPVGLLYAGRAGVGGGFIYDADYNGPPIAPQLDYRTNPGLKPRLFSLSAAEYARRNATLHEVFETALPGALAQKLIATHIPAFGKMSSFEQLLSLSAIGDWRANGLMYRRRNEGIDFRAINGLEALSAINEEFNKLMIAAQKRGAIPQSVKFSTRENFQAYATSSSEGFVVEVLVGNARNVVDKPTFYMAKLGDAISGAPEAAQIEAGFMTAARNAGISTTEFMVHRINADETILLTQRTDVAVLHYEDAVDADLDDELNVSSFRAHKLPINIALQVPERTRLDYADIAEFLASQTPTHEGATAAREDVLGRMFLNAFVNNTNDHLGQFEIIQDEQTGSWRLAPAHGVMVDDPDDHENTHALNMAGDASPEFSQKWVDKCSRALGVERDRGREIASKVLREIERLPDYWRSYGVSDETAARYVAATKPELRQVLQDVLDGRIGATAGKRFGM